MGKVLGGVNRYEFVDDGIRWKAYPPGTQFDIVVERIGVTWDVDSGYSIITQYARVTGARDRDGRPLAFPPPTDTNMPYCSNTDIHPAHQSCPGIRYNPVEGSL